MHQDLDRKPMQAKYTFIMRKIVHLFFFQNWLELSMDNLKTRIKGFSLKIARKAKDSILEAK